MTKRSKHDRAVRGYPEYAEWRELAEFLDSNPPTPEILRHYYKKLTYDNRGRGAAALEVLIRDRYPGFAVLERLSGKEEKQEPAEPNYAYPPGTNAGLP